MNKRILLLLAAAACTSAPLATPDAPSVPEANAFRPRAPWVYEESTGVSMLVTGHFNGDTYRDLAVGLQDGDKVHIFHGSDAGLPTKPSVTLSGPTQFGSSLAVADVNRDGCDDLFIAAQSSGEVRLHRCTDAGLEADAVWKASELDDAKIAVADVNGDHWTDLLVGLHTKSRLAVFLSADGVFETMPTRTLEGPATSVYFGVSLAGADVNQDGYDDVLVGDSGFDEHRGIAYLFHGSPEGLSPDPSAKMVGYTAGDNLGWSVDAAGDVDGDTFPDVAVGASGGRWNEVSSDKVGYAVIAYGCMADVCGGTGLRDAFTTIKSPSGAPGDAFGKQVWSAGDVNDDGYSDVIITAPFEDGAFIDEGTIYLFLGAKTGLTNTPKWQQTSDTSKAWFGFSKGSPAGDLDGGGTTDVIAATFNSTGRALAYWGPLFMDYGIDTGILDTGVIDTETPDTDVTDTETPDTDTTDTSDTAPDDSDDTSVDDPIDTGDAGGGADVIDTATVDTATDPTTAEDDAASDETAGGCGCVSNAGSPAMLLGAAALGLIRRKRR